jgi:diguanylate cyclase (GGDEF)-like protein/PAS domain S-box-containing protein
MRDNACAILNRSETHTFVKALTSEMKKDLIYPHQAAMAILVIIVLYLTSLYSYLLFHSITEVFTVVVMGSIFVLAWNTRHWMENGYFLFIGISFLLVGAIDFLHALAYKGMNVFPGYDANLPTQLWILARYIQSLSLLLAPAWLGKPLSPFPVSATYFAIGVLSLGLIFAGNFPTCYVENVGLTDFKIVSEYIIILILAGSSIPLFNSRKKFEPEVWQSLIVFIALTIAAELAFTTYFGVYDLSNLIGHLLRLFSYLFLYRALLITGLQTPYDLIFRDIKAKEAALQLSETNLQRLFDISPFPVIITRQSDASFVKANQATFEMLNLAPEELPKYTGLDFYANPAEREKLLGKLKEQNKIQNEPLEFRTKQGKPIWCLVNATPIDFGGEACLLVGLADITEQKRIQEELRFLSMHDALTGVYNRTYFEAEMERLKNSRRYPVSIIILDIDDLKIVNDTYGHAQGDKLLQTLAIAVSMVLRSEEVFARIGGDEFAILLPYADEIASRLVISRIRDSLDKHARKSGAERIKVSIGLGVAGIKDDLNEAFKQADANMYAVKHTRKGGTKSLREKWEKDR